MSELVKQNRTLGEWIRRGVEWSRMYFQSGVDFLMKGAEKRRTQIKLREFKAERLKKVPNYVVLEAARKHVRLGMEALFALSLAACFVFSWQLVYLSEKLTEKKIALVPSRLDHTIEVDVGRISESQAHATFVMYLSILSTVDSTNIDENYRMLKDYMSPELRVQFERETRDFRTMVRNENLSEQAIVSTKKIDIGKDGQIEAQAVLQIRPSIGSAVGKVRFEKVSMRMRVITNFEQNQWLLQITSLNRRPIETGVSDKGA
jgi:hypothetical protein